MHNNNNRFIELTHNESLSNYGGCENIWELLGYMFGMEFASMKANKFAPSVLPYK